MSSAAAIRPITTQLNKNMRHAADASEPGMPPSPRDAETVAARA
jgi:hypothetical protein